MERGMNLVKALKGVRKFLGKLTDVLLIGRNKGWWERKPGPPKLWK
jgi:hypothetical protein